MMAAVAAAKEAKTMSNSPSRRMKIGDFLLIIEVIRKAGEHAKEEARAGRMVGVQIDLSHD